MDKKKLEIIITICMIITLCLILILIISISTPSPYNCFKNVTLYGMDTCGYCQLQKKVLGENFTYINYINCNVNQAECINKGISAVPFWAINGNYYVGIFTWENLTEMSGCHDNE